MDISDVMKGWTHFYEDRIVTDSVTCEIGG